MNTPNRTLRIDDELYEAAREAAYQNRVSLAEYIRQAIQEKIEREEKGK
jgi:Ribbon-helix-helix protein, copG family.